MKTRWIVIVLFILHLIVGLGGLAGGYAGLTDIQQPLGAPHSMLEGSPFTSFFIPALFLFSVIGIGNLISALLVSRYSILGPLASFVTGFLLVAWIVIQCLVIHDIVALHVIFFCIGLMQVVLALWKLIASRDLPYLLGELLPS